MHDLEGRAIYKRGDWRTQVSERQYLITVDQPDWDEDDWEYLHGKIEYAVSTEVPSTHYTIQEFTK